MKMRVLTATKKKRLLHAARLIREIGESEYRPDVIPPAYACERERLVVIVLTSKKKYPDSLLRFCHSIDKTVASNVAFLVDGDVADIKTLSDIIAESGVNVMEDVFELRGGFPLKKKLSEDETADLGVWLKGLLDNLK